MRAGSGPTTTILVYRAAKVTLAWLKSHLVCLQEAYAAATEPKIRDGLLQRIGQLQEGSATLWVGGVTKNDLEERKELAERTAKTVRQAIMRGVLPGGGAALLPVARSWKPCASKVTTQRNSLPIACWHKCCKSQPVAWLQTPDSMRARLWAGFDEAGPGYAFDVRAERVVDMAQAGIWDAAGVAKSAVHSAVSGAALALTIDAAVHRKKPRQAWSP